MKTKGFIRKTLILVGVFIVYNTLFVEHNGVIHDPAMKRFTTWALLAMTVWAIATLFVNRLQK